MLTSLRKSMLLVFAIASCAAAQQSFTTSNESLEIHASIATTLKRLNKESYKLNGSITIANKTNLPQHYSNSQLHLLLNSQLNSRAYVDSIASTTIDFSSIEIKPNSKVVFKVYWPFKLSNSLKVDTLSLSLANSTP